MSYPDPGSWTPISTGPFNGVSPSSAPHHLPSIQEDSAQSNRAIYHLDTGTTIPTQEGQPTRPMGQAGTSYGLSQTGDMEDRPPGIDLMPSIPNSTIQNASFFSGAHHLIFHNPIMNAGGRPEIEREMLKLLKKKAMVDGTYDSAARHYTVPQCHPDTRVPLRERLIKWLLDTDREESLLWLYGPAGVGKSAIAQNIMEYCTQQGIPGAGLFLSRANGRDDPNRIIPSLAHQLALAYPAYRRLVSNILSADSSVLEKRLPLQFRQLIDEPADALRIETSNVKHCPILLLLDGLDECNTYEAQRELIKMLTSFALTCKARQLPFVCIVTSRPEWQIISTFDALGPTSGVWREELPMDTPEARRDVSVVLRDGFEHIKSSHSDAFSADVEWPASTDVQTIESAASGNMLFASLVVTFVDDDYPTIQLELCLKFLQGKLTSDQRNPFEPLTALYRGLLLSIPPTLLRTALLILYFQLSVNDASSSDPYSSKLPAQQIANFLFIGQTTFYGSLKRLRSVLSIPPPADASYKGLIFSHTTFADYVKVAVQTGHFGLCEVDALTDIRMACIKWHHLFVENGDSSDISDIVPWHGINHYHIYTILAVLLFKLWRGLLHRGDVGKLQEELANFSFKDLPRDLFFPWNTVDDDLMELAQDLITNVRDLLNHFAKTGAYIQKIKSSKQIQSSVGTCIVRTVPLWPTDYQLINKYVGLFGQWAMELKPLDWDLHPPRTWDGVHLVFCSIEDSFDDADVFGSILGISRCLTIAYFLLGHSQNTTLVIIYPRAMDLQVYWEEAFEKIKAPSHFLGNPQPGDLLQSIYSYSHHNLNSLNNNEGNQNPILGQVISCDNLACNIVSYVADPWHGNPYSRLRIVSDVLSFTSDPTEIICHLSHHIIGNIPHGISYVAQQVLALLIISSTSIVPHTVHLEDLEHFMCLEYTTINSALQWLHPLVLSWRPDPLDPSTAYLHLRLPYVDLQGNSIDYHNDLWRELGHEPWFGLEEEVWVGVFCLWVQWSIGWLTTGHNPFPSSEVNKAKFISIPWIALYEIRTSDGIAAAATQLCDFPFCYLAQGLVRDLDFCNGFEDLISRLSSDSGFAPLLRTQPICPTDYLLLKKWAGFGHHSEILTLPIKIKRNIRKYYPISLSTIEIPPPKKEDYRIFLIGYGENTCLIAMMHRKKYKSWDDAEASPD
ncbi:hypothetical protein D9756_010175 [Leucocoprinus leucothites]|uniref:Nephrocystin 3-like N-terminal domain-containing protein n=1 Tax=Leucocoprinus leucothites TaxID=201217 RepID=A0A8H5CV91_9AGAR|nr:hypothetical protein D9756_010175 [Leucoagaricus leucothites]